MTITIEGVGYVLLRELLSSPSCLYFFPVHKRPLQLNVTSSYLFTFSAHRDLNPLFYSRNVRRCDILRRQIMMLLIVVVFGISVGSGSWAAINVSAHYTTAGGITDPGMPDGLIS